MATYYIRKTGSDSNAGTSSGAAWLTIGKALGASGIASGDTVYIGAGVYREVVTVAMTSAVAETKIYADVDGSQTGDFGEVQWTGYTTNDVTVPSSSPVLNLSGRDFLTFQNIVFISGSAQIVQANTNTATDIKFTRCSFIQAFTAAGAALINITAAADIALNWTIDSCTFINGSNAAIGIIPVRPSVADLNLNIVIKNCINIGFGQFCQFSTSGVNSFKVGGVTVYNCTIFNDNIFIGINNANWLTSTPVNAYNNFIYNGGNNIVFSANTLGQIIENNNLILGASSPRTNVTAGAKSIADGSYSPLFFTGHEYYSVGANLQPFGMPKPGSPLLGFGNQAASPTTDILQAARPSGFVKGGTGTATSGAAKTLTDTNQTWGTNVFAGYTVKIISGTGSGQTKTINANTATVLTVDGNWKTNPSSDSVYEIYLRAMSSTGTATSGTTTTLTDSNAVWGTNMWQGYTLTIDAGTGSGQTFTVTSNTATALTFAAGTAPDNTSTYSLYRGTGISVINAGVGCYEFGQSAIKETSTVRSGTNSLRIAGAGYQDFIIPVNNVQTTISIYAQYDAAYSGTLPSMSIVNGTEAGVSNATATQVGAASAWEQLSLTFTPTSNGIITVRLISSSTTPTGNAFYDDFAVV